jgi:flavin reductase (DIM6/NTAB) family NADH-FMN oxidoreductase RutF
MMAVDPSAYRQVMSRLATGVTVLSASRDGGHEVMTANAVMSVSLDPVLLVASVRRGCRLAAAARAAGSFAVNVLSAEQEELSRWCASPVRHGSADDLYRHPHRRTWTDALVFDDALATFDCDLYEEHPLGDHDLLVGEVTGMHVNDIAPPLLFFAGGYTTSTVDRHESVLQELRASC